jgi:hypothetical protein
MCVLSYSSTYAIKIMRRKGHGLFLKSSVHMLLLSKTRVCFSCYVAGWNFEKRHIQGYMCVAIYSRKRNIKKGHPVDACVCSCSSPRTPYYLREFTRAQHYVLLSGIRKAAKAKRYMLRAAVQQTILKSYLHPVYVFASAVLANYSFLLFPKLGY